MKRGLFILIFAMLLCMYACDDSKPNQPPILVIAANPTTGSAPLTVNFTSSAEDGDGIIAGYSWNFGDGAGSSTEQNPAYTYNSTGTFTATCIVRDNGSPVLTATATVAVTVYQSKIPSLSSISPGWSVIHMPEFTLKVTGSDFFPDSKIVFNDKVMNTVYISSTQLTCEIMPDDTVLSAFLKNDGSLDLQADQYASVLVRNPGTGGGDSAVLNFTVRANHIFETPQLVSSKSSNDSYYYMEIIKSGSLYVYLIYHDLTPGPYPEELHLISASRNNGRSWSKANQMPFGVFSYEWDLEAGNDGILYMVNLGNNEMYIRKSFDDGASWTDPVLVYEGTPDDYQFEYWGNMPNIIRLNDGMLYAASMESKHEVWVSDGEFYGSWAFRSYSNDGGSTWSAAEKVPNSTDNIYFPTLEKSLSGSIHYFYATGGHDPHWANAYRHTVSSNNGASWSNPVEILPFTNLMQPPIVGDDEGLYIPDKTVGASSQEISVKYWLDGSATWGKTPAAVSLGLSQTIVTISVSVDAAGNINLFYTRGSNAGNYAVYYQRSIDLGKTWTAPLRISPLGCRTGSYSQICGAVGNLFVVWASVNSPYPIYFTSSERNRE